MMGAGEEENGRNNLKIPCLDEEEQYVTNDIHPISLDLSLGLNSTINPPRTTPSPPQIQQEDDSLPPPPSQLCRFQPPSDHHQSPSPIIYYNPSFHHEYTFLAGNNINTTTTSDDDHQDIDIGDNPLQLPPTHIIYNHNQPPPENSGAQPPSSHQRMRGRRNPTQAPREGKCETVPPPFPWATNRRATVHSLDYLLSRQIYTISGDVQCKRCERKYQIEFQLQRKFDEVAAYIVKNKFTLMDRAPSVWLNPVLPTCRFCEQENSAKPVISERKKSINWLFLLLGQMLGCCTLDQLKYFCKHTKNHRTGAKDRVLFLTYLGLCKQLVPHGPFDRI